MIQKKTYKQPEVRIFELRQTDIVCTSPQQLQRMNETQENGWGDE